MKIEEMTLEQAIKTLEETAQKLECEDASIEDSLKAFEEGVKLVSRCRELLAQYDKRITQLKKTAQGIEEGDMPSGL